MHDTLNEDPPRLTPVVRKSRRFSPIWIIPVVAALLGLWLAVKFYSERGPKITVHFETAEGVVAGKTPVLCRSVNVGVVDAIGLTENLKGVLVTMQMTAEATRLLTDDAQIWVVRPRYGAAGISGLSTLVSGSYIELEPGLSKEPRREFEGLEQPPVTPTGVPGLHITFFADEAGSIAPGTAIQYKGLSAGKIETRQFHPDNGKIEFGAFIFAEFAPLVRENTKFWNVSGIDVQIGANGFELHAGTLESLLSGGITFGQPEGALTSTPPVQDGATFTLYASFADTKKFAMKNSLPYLLLFTGSARGLNNDAPVEFRGVRIGTVSGVSFKYLPDDSARRVPVLVQIDPTLITNLPTQSTEPAEKFIEEAVQNGLRASLKTGSLITGQMYVDLDFQKDVPAASVVEIAGYRVIPTGGSSLAELQDKASALLDKLQALPLEETVKNASAALDSIKAAAEDLNKTMSGYGENGALYQKLTETLRQLDETLRSVRTLSNTIERKPNSLIFGKPGKVAPPKGTPEQ